MLKIGSHVSFKSPNYLIGAVEESLKNEGNAMMIYLGAPQSTTRVDISNYRIDEYRKNFQDKIKPEDIIIHAPYIINLANENKCEFGKKFLISEIERMNHIDAKYIVLHPGSFLNQDKEYSINLLANNLKEILDKTKNVCIVLETMAGKGTEIGSSLEELKKIIDIIGNNERVGICLDTCHLWDAGYDIKNDFENNNGNDLIKKLKQLELLEKVKVIHLNDSKNEINSKKDRHENIGYGKIGYKALWHFANHQEFDNIPIILETPYFDHNISPYLLEIKLIKAKHEWKK